MSYKINKTNTIYSDTNASTGKKGVSKPDSSYNECIESWKLCDDMLLDSYNIRKTNRIIKHSNEKNNQYNNRITSSFMPPGYKEEINIIVGDISNKYFINNELTFKDIHPDIKKHFLRGNNFDGNGNDFNVVLTELIYQIVHYGSCGGIVDYNNESQSLFFKNLLPPNIIGCSKNYNNGINTITQIREFCEIVTYDEVDFNEISNELINVYTMINGQPVFNMYIKNKEDEFIKSGDDIIITNIKGEPLQNLPVINAFASYSTKKSPFRSIPLMIKLASLNEQLLNLQSDHNYIVKTSMVPIMFNLCGKDSDGQLINRITEDEPLTVGVVFPLFAGDEEQNKEELGYIDTSKLEAGVKLGQTKIDEIKKEMQLLSYKVFNDNDRNITATLSTIEQVNVNSQRKSIEIALVDFTQNMIYKFGEYYALEKEICGLVNIVEETTLKEETALKEETVIE